MVKIKANDLVAAIAQVLLSEKFIEYSEYMSFVVDYDYERISFPEMPEDWTMELNFADDFPAAIDKILGTKNAVYFENKPPPYIAPNDSEIVWPDNGGKRLVKFDSRGTDRIKPKKPTRLEIEKTLAPIRALAQRLIDFEDSPMNYGFLWAAVQITPDYQVEAVVGSGSPDNWHRVEVELQKGFPQVKTTWVNMD